LTVISMGSGAGCDVQYLFAVDILGENTGKVPRHARVYESFAAEYAKLQERRVVAFQAFRSDVLQGSFPQPSETVGCTDEDVAAFEDWLGASRKQGT